MTIRAKFKVQSVSRSAGWGEHKEVHTVRMVPVSGGSPENAAFYAATPSGTVELGLVSAAIGSCFDIGREFYLDFTPADAPAETPEGGSEVKSCK